MTMKIQYKGQFDEVIVPAWVDERGYPQPPVARGVPIEVGDELGASLLEQADNWEKAPAAAERKTVPSSPGE